MPREPAASIQLTPEGEQQWQRLLNHLRWSDDFSLILIFSQHAPIVELFRLRLEQFYRLRVSGLNQVRLESPAQLLNDALPAILGQNIGHTLTKAPVWLNLTHTDHEDHWPETRRKFYRRLNENRETLRQQNRALIIVLPAAEKQSFRELAPDLWAIRDVTVETQNWLALTNEMTLSARDQSTANIPATPFSETDQQLIDEWHRVKDKPYRGALLAAERALKVSLLHGQLSLAEQIAGNALKLSRQLLQQLGATPQTLRDLSVSLNNIGDVAQQLGQLETAQG
ncbi:hypothetical protein, partial [Nitrosomonas sp.]|uniref:hypothetical protein n=1 Tax=Nitrosomonas sp. TaxID=42353 RepID=UPI0035AFB0AA